MARTKKPPTQEKPQFSIHTVSLTAGEIKVLGRLNQDASDFLGRTVSSSAVMRALLRQIEKQGPSAADDLFFEIERELKAGKLWGRKKE